jgi:predicted nucleotidyltransferase
MDTKSKITKNKIKETIVNIDPNVDIILYGSRARGDERPNSDWDILILTGYPVSITKEREFRNALYDLELETGEVFSVFIYSRKDWNEKQSITPFYQNVTSEGIRI